MNSCETILAMILKAASIIQNMCFLLGLVSVPDMIAILQEINQYFKEGRIKDMPEKNIFRISIS